jgi:hypothetical protein
MPRNNLAHGTGIGRPGTLASRLEEPLPSLLVGGREDGNGFGVEGYLGINQINNAVRALLAKSARPGRRDRCQSCVLLVARIQFAEE